MPASTFSDLVKLTDNSGSIPDALLPCSEIVFRYQYQIDLTDQLEFSTGDIVIVDIAVTFDVLDASGNLLLEVALAATYLCSQDEFGFSYYPSQQSVTATPAVTEIGDPTGIIIQGDSGAGSASGADIIFDTFETPIFVLAVPAGSTVKITFHTAGYPALDDIEGLQVSTRPGGGWASGFRHGTDGQAHLAYPGSAGVSTVIAVGRARTLLTPTARDWGADTPVAYLRLAGRTVQIAVYGKGGSTFAQVSTNEGVTFTMETLWTGFTFVDAVQRDGGVTVLLATSAGAFIAYRDRAGTASTPAPIVLPAGVKLSAGRLLGESGGLDYFQPAASGVLHLHSDDEIHWS
ncbi:MAG: hypothetical protein ACRYFS_03610 [Janthinobacterium lividum]